MEKVNVLLSAYNGERYIRTQIDSILNQTWENLELWVRDDGSSDTTREILKEYEQDPRVHVIYGQNVGFCQSFFEVTRSAGCADYYAFADQDDFWYPEKLGRAVEMLRKEDPGQPLLYFSDYALCNGELEFLRLGKEEKRIKNISFGNALVECLPLGFTQVFNRSARDRILSGVENFPYSHDFWNYLVCQSMGKVIYDPTPLVKYRRHEKAVSVAGADFLKFQIWRMKEFLLSDGRMLQIRQMHQTLQTLWAEQLPGESRRVLSWFTAEGYHPGRALQKVFFSKPYRQTLFDELAVRVLFLIGKM